MRGSKTTAIKHVRAIVKILNKENILNISYGIIINVRNRRDHTLSIKIRNESGAKLISVTSKLYKQELRIYDNVSEKILKDIIKNKLTGKFRLL